ncbi:MAG: NAD-dependent epimerase/dehydratase family protein [Planctomycetota bacterium]|nr:MAG: NAD-dependent epimerase/dehydratase family protein [Planctomycetota bacterium]REK24145.1 MAG: NAD-dependent epimerase/dehydratase family protein [Planctomycetota bacterium]REK38279.1 MAG: NAD-dependent epimerase/dehydratase family protein [Planctomycetota bacterium]
MRCLVTGGGGFLGRYIVEQLLDRGEDVRIFSRRDYPELSELGVTVVQGDLRDESAVQNACRDVETVFHCAAIPGVWGPWKLFYEINTVGARNILTACRSNGVRKLIYTSSPSVVYDGNPHENADESLPYPDQYLCHYSHTKALAEREVLEANDPDRLLTLSLRPHLIWGPRDNHLIPRLIRKARTGRLRRVGDGRNLISVSYVENAARAHLQAADALQPGSPVAGRAYFLNEPEPVNLWDFVNAILRRAGLPPVERSITAKAAWRIGAALERIYGVLRITSEPPMTRFVASQLSQSHYYDISAARRDFGYQPQISIEEGLQRMQADLDRWASRRDG